MRVRDLEKEVSSKVGERVKLEDKVKELKNLIEELKEEFTSFLSKFTSSLSKIISRNEATSSLPL